MGVCVHVLLPTLIKNAKILSIMSGFNDGYPQYELMALHDEETGKVVRKKLWKVFWIMLIITIAELIIGFQAADWGLTKTFLKIVFISLTILKAGYIVLSFMHLGDENKPLKFAVLVPFIVFILYLIMFVDIFEGTYSKDNRYIMDKNVTNKTAPAAHDAEHH